ncbi:nucleoid-associated protein [Salinicola socius]|uniref:F-box domain-containing protein n=1 Tax=Salinicola socius TaxID=404433 RepID=A0A1Q8SPH4_9GAMM|nr:nucleoid-associated protein [Salinicola socius]OLO03315.1 hypothetical protein BTW07_14620 [Salinicola socius]
MRINSIIVHELVKDQHEAIQPSNYRQTVLDPDNDLVVKLLQGITAIYGSRYNSAHYGTFAEGEGRGAFPDTLLAYSAIDQPDEQQFIAITMSAMERLYDKASSSPAATGGYMVFSDYVSENTRFLLIAMIKKTPGLTLTEELVPEELERLDLKKLHQAARINFEKLDQYLAADVAERDELNYLSFISSTSSESASGYFVSALGCSAGTAASKATNNLIRESKVFFKDNDHLRDNKDAFVSELVSYLSEKQSNGESVKLSEIGQLVHRHIPPQLADQADETVNNFLTRLNSEEVSVPSEFPVSKSALKKHTQIKGDGDNWKFSFEISALSDDEAAEIYYDRDCQTLTLSRLPQDMIDQILSVLDDDE